MKHMRTSRVVRTSRCLTSELLLEEIDVLGKEIEKNKKYDKLAKLNMQLALLALARKVISKYYFNYGFPPRRL